MSKTAAELHDEVVDLLDALQGTRRRLSEIKHELARLAPDELDVDEIGIEHTEGMAMWPGASVSGWYFSHPSSQYFVVGRVGKDQVEDYARRKGWSLEEAERWLSPNLGYVPEA